MINILNLFGPFRFPGVRVPFERGERVPRRTVAAQATQTGILGYGTCTRKAVGTLALLCVSFEAEKAGRKKGKAYTRPRAKVGVGITSNKI